MPAADELPASAESVVPAPVSVAGAEESVLLALVVSVDPAAGADAVVSAPVPRSVGAAAGDDGDAELVDVAELEGSDGVVVGAEVDPPDVPVGDPPDSVGAGVSGVGVVDWLPEPEPTVGVIPPVVPEPGPTVGVEAAAAEVVEVLEVGDEDAGPPVEVDVAVPVDGVGMTTGAATEPSARGAGCEGMEAISRSRRVGGAAAR